MKTQIKILFKKAMQTIAVAALLLPSIALAMTLQFQNITHNIAGDAAIGEAQLFVDVTNLGSNLIEFKFRNAGTNPSSITDIYFEDGSSIFDAIDTLTHSSGVDFAIGATPSNLPGGNSITPPFVATYGLTADSNPPIQPNGINPDEWLKVNMALNSGFAFNDVVSALNERGLRIGIHVQGFETGGSESYVNTVPLPAGAYLFGSALIGLAGIGYRRKS